MTKDTSSHCNLESSTGKVKWFNNKAGYGFITVVSDDKDNYNDHDIFVHHTALTTNEDHYNYLVEGEYVWFNVEETNQDKHRYQAANVRGPYNNSLMCETRYLKTKNNDWKEVKHKHRPNKTA